MIKKLLGTILVVILLGLAVLFTPLGERPLAMAFSAGEVSLTDFAAIELGPNPNQYLLCPENACKSAPHSESPEFNLPLPELQKMWVHMVAHKPRVEQLNSSENGEQIDYIQRTKLFRYPDVITVRFIKVTEMTSSLAIYSRSIYGLNDFGKNKERIDQWMISLEELAKQ